MTLFNQIQAPMSPMVPAPQQSAPQLDPMHVALFHGNNFLATPEGMALTKKIKSSMPQLHDAIQAKVTAHKSAVHDLMMKMQNKIAPNSGPTNMPAGPVSIAGVRG